jgi:hypothetical protein
VQAGQLVAKQFADRGIVEDVTQSAAYLSLEVRVETADGVGDLVGDSQPAHGEPPADLIGKQFVQGIELRLSTSERP